jgi:hypothetical protein
MVDDPYNIFQIPLHVLLDRQEEIKKPKKKSYPMFLPNEAFDKDDSKELLQRYRNEVLGDL